ncbi:hypothetical protein NEFER03_0590 [Nematocida sp. LUAm3]|nr:hypothetical protein NEFER03_0590 [Nematocida sp. LUAm3]KAI5175557.1 hypothetical protein NEFER02_1463 [Nematocida sp. LUAm2]KAI5178413.1 hypothetical protein NEFER01_1560 [Nematocida sp. LUAm1]
MKYLELECMTKIAEDIFEIEESIPGISIRVEAYSLKKTREEKKISGSRKYKRYSDMISAALSLMFFGYEVSVTAQEMSILPEEECKASVVNQLFTLGITKDYLEMVHWVDKLFSIIVECTGKDACFIGVDKQNGPFEKCFWKGCIAAYGKEKKRIVVLVVMYANQHNSPIM